MTRDELLAELRILRQLEAGETGFGRRYDPHAHDTEWTHDAADVALLKFINDPEIADAFNALPKWYA